MDAKKLRPSEYQKNPIRTDCKEMNMKKLVLSEYQRKQNSDRQQGTLYCKIGNFNCFFIRLQLYCTNFKHTVVYNVDRTLWAVPACTQLALARIKYSTQAKFVLRTLIKTRFTQTCLAGSSPSKNHHEPWPGGSRFC